MIDVGIIGGAGYTAGELIRLLIHHEQVKINFVFSTSSAGKGIHEVHHDLVGSTNLKFTDQINLKVDVLFLCLGHGNSKKFLEEHQFAEYTKIIDLSNDFRLEGQNSYQGYDFVYGLPELNKEAIKKAKAIANPGCFATAIQLALLPLAANSLLIEPVHINAVTGATGAGVSLSKTTHFAWRDNNFSYYKPFVHQHLAEIQQSIKQAGSSTTESFYFLPNRGNFSRGIFATAYTKFKGTLDEVIRSYEVYYKEAPFTYLSKNELYLKQVVNTNKCLIHLHVHEDTLLISSCIDNLVKGASGQAVQNMNLLFGFKENQGLQLKANFF